MPTYLPLYRVHKALCAAPCSAAFQVNLRDLLKQNPVLTFDLRKSILHHLLILLLVDLNRLRWKIVRYWLHLSQLLPVQTQVFLSPLPGEELRRPSYGLINNLLLSDRRG